MWPFTKSKGRILKDLQENRPLPMGRKEFEIWSTRIINAALIPGATVKSLQWTLANELLHVKPGVCFEADGYFVSRLRKFCVNEVAAAMASEIRDSEKARLAEEEKQKGVVVPSQSQPNETKILAN